MFIDLVFISSLQNTVSPHLKQGLHLLDVWIFMKWIVMFLFLVLLCYYQLKEEEKYSE